MELTVIRIRDQRRMVVSVQAQTESEALRTIQKAVGPVTRAFEHPVELRRRPITERHARDTAYF
ncbi:hypothetical protein [Leifsonia sp. SIMBA_070]|uniref:hypothetical protein n=1 Tax=Leifsonia sp. SIMBA_070 TaxID=3085810 RepID=UPI00397CBE4F